MVVIGCLGFQVVVVCVYNSWFGFGGGVYYGGIVQEGLVEFVYFGVMSGVVLVEVGVFDESLWCGEDWEFNYCFCQVGKIVWFDLQLCVIYWLWSMLGKFMC